jgi:3-dehydroquinate synthase
MIRVRVPGVARVTVVRVGRGLMRRAGPILRTLHAGDTAALVTDRTVGRLYAARVETSLERAGFRVVRATLPVGERSKSIGTFRALCDRWSEEGIGRDTIVVALGGGVVSDVAGFAASTFARGLTWAALPTTILAQADASIGGKVGINLPGGKNLVGAFHHPAMVLADTEALRTLTPRAYRAGLAEVLKIGVIRRPEILSRLYRLAARGGWGHPRALEPLIRMAAAEKARLVSKDERDRSVRLALNFGHSVGHALEAAYGYRRYLHGEAVALGMVAALRLSVLEIGLDPIVAIEVESILRQLGLPTRLHRFPGRRFWKALERDKKRGRAGLRMILCPAIGKSKVFELSSLTALRRVVLSLVRQT